MKLLTNSLVPEKQSLRMATKDRTEQGELSHSSAYSFEGHQCQLDSLLYRPVSVVLTRHQAGEDIRVAAFRTVPVET